MFTRKVQILLAVVGVVCAVPASAHAYTCAYGDVPDCAVWCDGGPVTYQIGQLPDGFAEADVESAVQGAAALWNDTNCGVTLEYVGRTPGGGRDADIELTWLATWDSNFGNPQTTFSVAAVSSGADNCLVPGQILLNDQEFEWNVDGTTTDMNQDILSNASVQLGRMLGLGNSDDPDNSILTPTAGSEAITELGSDDVEGLCAIYEDVGGDAGMGGDDTGMGGDDAGTADMGTAGDMGGSDETDAGTEGGSDMGDGEPDMDGSTVDLIDDSDADSDSGCCATIGSGGSGAGALAFLFLIVLGVRRERQRAPARER